MQVSAPAGCAWTASATHGFITFPNGNSGVGNGEVTVNVAPEQVGLTRFGTAVIAGKNYGIVQSPQGSCTYALASAGQTFGLAGGNGQVAVSASSCSNPWVVHNSANWIAVYPLNGQGNGVVNFEVAANNTGAPRVGTFTVSGRGFTITQTSPSAPTSVVSRKTQGTAGAFDINLPLDGNAGVECRSGGVNSEHQIVLTFPSAVTLSGASVTPEPGQSGSVVGSPGISPDGKTVTVNLTAVTDAQTITLTLSGVNNGTSTNDVGVPMHLVLGDTTANGVVNASDIGQTKSQSGQAVTNSNFRTDVTANGEIKPPILRS